jgi:hypothetical protein
MPSVQQKRGLYADLPSSSLKAGEVYFTTDRQTAHFPTDATTMVAVVPAIDSLSAIGAVDGASDLLIMHDSSATGLKEKKITFTALKTALNIPDGDADEKVAVVDGGTAGYIFGTDGTDGILRMNTSMVMTKDGGDGFVTLAVGSVDCGTF